MACLVASHAGCAAVAPVHMRALSTRPGFVTGGNALVGLEIPAGVDAQSVKVRLGGQDVTERFFRCPTHWPAATSADLCGLVEALPQGSVRLTAAWQAIGSFRRGGAAELNLTNHPRSGPLISGPHEKPFICGTTDFVLPSGKKLGPPVDEHCGVATRIEYVYRNTAGALVPWLRERGRPVDLATTLTSDNQRVPFIVRYETGTINRAIYQIAVLHDPSIEFDLKTRNAGWNGKLIYTHGGGCRRGWYRQGSKVGEIPLAFLERGYAVATSSLNVFGQNCNDLVASETHMMVKEHFVETYGPPLFTIGIGGSGGSVQCHLTADNYPGVFDGILVQDSFPDVTSASVFTMTDARLLLRVFDTFVKDPLTLAQKQAITGLAELNTLVSLSDGAARVVAANVHETQPGFAGGEFADEIPEAHRYSADRPQGLRPTLYDHAANVYGRDPAGKALRPLDNVGVQYGLQAFNEGAITLDLFLRINRMAGGYGRDGEWIPTRTVADPAAAKAAHHTGRVLSGRGGLSFTPVVDFREYRDDQPSGDIHMFVHSLATRARLMAANGHLDNHVLIVRPDEASDPPGRQVMPYLEALDLWLTRIASDRSKAEPVEKMRRAKPATLTDHCVEGVGNEALRIDETWDPKRWGTANRCTNLFPVRLTPRQVAGAPLANNVIKCARKPVDPGDYKQALTKAELDQVREVFPDGVCDWAKPDPHAGYGGTWQSLPP